MLEKPSRTLVQNELGRFHCDTKIDRLHLRLFITLAFVELRIKRKIQQKHHRKIYLSAGIPRKAHESFQKKTTKSVHRTSPKSIRRSKT